MATNTKTNYNLHLKGFVGGYDFDADYVDYILSKHEGKEVHVLIDSLGGRSNTALSIFSAFKRHGNVNVHFVGMNASAATIASLGAKHITMPVLVAEIEDECAVVIAANHIFEHSVEPKILRRAVGGPAVQDLLTPEIFHRIGGMEMHIVPEIAADRPGRFCMNRKRHFEPRFFSIL